ncbi:helix-turn-helix transcriptional regulator [Spirosoma litoris]
MDSQFILTTPSQLKALLEEAVRSGLANYQSSIVQQQTEDRWLTIEELSSYLPGKPAVTTLYSKVQHREIPHKRMGKRLVFLKSEVDDYLKNQRCKTRMEINTEADEYLAKNRKGRATWSKR